MKPFGCFLSCNNVEREYIENMYFDDVAQTECEKRTDEAILMNAQKDPHCFSVLLDRYQDAFMRKAMSILRSREESEEVVQETFTKIYVHGAKFKPQEGASFNSWAYKILINTSLTRYQKLKKHKNRTADLDPELYEMLPDKVTNDFEHMEVYDYIVSALVRIPATLSKALTSHFIDGRSHKEVAAEEGVSIGAIKTRVHRAKKVFREELEKLSTNN